MRTKNLALAAAFLVAVVAATLTPGTAHAERRRPLYAGFGIGAYVHFDHASHFRGSGQFGWHFSGTDTGFFMAVEAVPIGGHNFFAFHTGLRLGGDIEVYENRNIAVILRPSGFLGLGLYDWGDDGYDVWGAFVTQPAFDIRLALADHLLQLWVRPAALDIVFFPNRYGRDWDVDVAYVVMTGLDFTF